MSLDIRVLCLLWFVFWLILYLFGDQKQLSIAKQKWKNSGRNTFLQHCILFPYTNSIILQRFLNLGIPATLRFWEENEAPEDPLKPNRASALSVETTAYMLLNTLLRGDTTYAKPIIQWLTDDQRYGGGFHSTQVHSRSKKK